MHNKLILILFLFTHSVMATDSEFILSEKSLKKLIANHPPTIKKIEASYQKSRIEKLAVLDQFDLNLKSSVYHKKSKERQLNQFIPVTSPINSFSIGLVQPTQHGLNIGLKTDLTQTTNNFVSEATTATLGLSLSMDLHNNLLGRLTKAKIKGLDLEVKKAAYQKRISEQTFLQNIRKLYWAIVANQEAMNITEKLKATAKQQVTLSLKRQRSGVSDSGEVSRYKSQFASRSAALLSLEYQKSDLVQQLKILLPELALKNVQLAPYSIPDTVKRVLACTTLIQKQKEVPVEFTFYDEIVSLLKNQELEEKKVTNSYGSWDLKLETEYNSIGKDFSYNESFNDLKDSGKPSYQVGLALTIPLGDSQSETRSVKQELDKKRFEYQQEENIAKIRAYHSQMVKSVSLLQLILKNQAENTYHLAESLKVSTRKFNQARIDVDQLVNEQDSYFQSNLSEIQSNLSIITTLLDYFSIYTETPCDLNRI